MRIAAKVLEDSTSNHGIRLVTLELTYPRYIHAEFMTHRVFSRNASSSRAIPISKQIDLVQRQPVMPLEWGQNKPGMQAGEAISRAAQTQAEDVWCRAANHAVDAARKLKDLGVHKQIVNRLLEPFAFIKVIVTSTEWDNFFALRISSLAQPEIRDLAEKILDAMNASTPKFLLENKHGHIHAPYLTDEERTGLDTDTAMLVSAARCARVSYLNHDGLNPDLEKDINLACRLKEDKHASTFEHQATPRTDQEFCRNFRGWYQHRAMLGL